MEPGDVISERFVIESLAGRGGMGAVFRALDLLTGEPVALKVLREDSSRHAERFAREAVMLSTLRHPGIVRYVAHGSTPEGERFLAMEWLEGEDLADRLACQGLSPEESLALISQVASALAVVHARGVLHRDLKPRNLFLLAGEVHRVKVLDFGIARQDTAAALTRTGVTVGSPGYMAPEQARGERDLTPAVDVFALGCVWFECLAGRPPFRGDNVLALLAKVLLEEAPRIREERLDVPDDVDDLLARMLSKDPSRRPPDGAALAAALASLEPLAHGRPSYASGVPQVLTSGELRLFSVVLVASPSVSAVTLEASRAELGAPMPDVSTTASAYGGRVEPLADGSLAVGFAGVGTATDQAARAARCALALHALAPGVPIALATGRGRVARRTLVGEVIERAAALALAPLPVTEGGAVPLRVDGVTAGLLGEGYHLQGAGDVWALLGAREPQFRAARTLLGRPSPFVGRDRELRVLEACWDECVGERVARAVVVTAPAGAGKSRLRQEFLESLRGDEQPPLVLHGRGDPVAPGAPFGLVASALRGACDVSEGLDHEAARARVRALAEGHLGPVDGARVAHFLGELVGVRFPSEDSIQLKAARLDARLMGDQLRRAWEDWLAAECAARPVVLVLEDLHWGDLPSVQLVDAVLRALHDRPLLVLALGRPEVEVVFPELWRARSAQELRLGELGARAAEKLVRGVLGEATTPDRVARLVAQAGGNAFYLEELIRAEAEGRGGALPGTVLAMAQARLEAMEPEARQVLRAASVFGREFRPGGVRALLGDGPDAPSLDLWLLELRRREVIVPGSEGRASGGDGCAFRHALLREAAYAMLLEEDRALGHRLAGAWLEAMGEREALVLAEHFERGGAPERAAGWYCRAAEQALEGNDLAAVLARAERGVACGAKGEALGGLRALQAVAHKWRGEIDRAAARGEEALEALPRGSGRWFHAAGEYAAACGNMGDFERLSPVLEVVCAPPVEGEVVGVERALAAARVAVHLISNGRPETPRVMAWLEEVGLPAAGGDPIVSAAALEAEAFRVMAEGDAAACRACMDAAADQRDRAGDLRGACISRGNAAFAAIELGGLAEAEAALLAVVEAADRLALPVIATHAKQNLVLVYTRQGRLSEAKTLGERLVREYRFQSSPRAEGVTRTYLAEALARSGKLEEAEREAREALDVLAAVPPRRCLTLAVLAWVLGRRGRHQEALESAREAMALLEALGGLDEGESLVRLAHVEALAACGEGAAAREALREAYQRLQSRAERLCDPAWRARFLGAVEVNARTLELARAWLGAGGV